MFDEINFLISYNNFILVLQNNSSHSTLNRVKCENKFCPRWGLNQPTTSCIRGKRLTARRGAFVEKFLAGAFVEKNTFKVF